MFHHINFYKSVVQLLLMQKIPIESHKNSLPREALGVDRERLSYWLKIFLITLNIWSLKYISADLIVLTELLFLLKYLFFFYRLNSQLIRIGDFKIMFKYYKFNHTGIYTSYIKRTENDRALCQCYNHKAIIRTQ